MSNGRVGFSRISLVREVFESSKRLIYFSLKRCPTSLQKKLELYGE
jgi:hypothetical protein